MPLHPINKPIGYVKLADPSSYLLTEQDIKKEFPNTSFSASFVPPEGYDAVFFAPQPAYDPITQGVREGQPILTSKGHWEQTWEVYALEPEQVAANIEAAQAALQSAVTQAIQKMLDAKAQEYEYDSIHTANGWASTFPDAAALHSWGVACWVKSKQIRDAVVAGTRPVPTVAEVIDEMPAFVEPLP